jgi:hypothetical protein
VCFLFGYFPGVRLSFAEVSEKMDLTEGSETSAKKNLTPGKYPIENIQDSEHGENLKSRSDEILKFSDPYGAHIPTLEATVTNKQH